MQMFSVTAGSCFTKFRSAEQPRQIQFICVSSAVLQTKTSQNQNTTEIPRKKPSSFSKKAISSTHMCTHILWQLAVQLSITLRISCISIHDFKNIDRLTLWKFTHWLLQSDAEVFGLAFLSCLGSGFGLLVWFFFLRKGIVCSCEGGFLDLS